MELKSPNSIVDLPDPDDRPKADVVIYDGSCPVCCGVVQRLDRLDGHGRLAFLSIEDPRVAERYGDLPPEQLQTYVHVIDSTTGRRRKGVRAIRYLTRRLPALWGLASFLHIPGSGFLWRWLYHWFSSHRYRLVKSHCEKC